MNKTLYDAEAHGFFREPWGGFRTALRATRACSCHDLRLLAVAVLLVTLCQGHAPAQTNKPDWDLHTLGRPPKWEALQQPISTSKDVKAIFFTGLPFHGKPTRVFAWLGIPHLKPGQKAPGMVLVHGGGGTAFEEWVRLWVQRGYAAIAVDTCGQVPVGNYGNWVHDEQGGPPGWGGWNQLDWPMEDQWTYHAVADAMLANSLLRSLPDVDPERIGLTGISWGGYLTSIIAGVDARFKCAAPVYGCGFYPDTLFNGDLRKLSPEQRDRWMRWWDPSNYLGEAKMPLLWVSGAKDHFYPLTALQKSYRQAPGPRNLAIRVQMTHGQGEGEAPEEIQVFVNSVLNDGTPLLRITGQGHDQTNVWAAFVAPVRVVKADLNYTAEVGVWEKREWHTIPAVLAGTNVTAALPPGTRAYYLNLFDERGCVICTEHEEPGAP